MATQSKLRAAMRHRELVRFSRRFEDSLVRGYVLEVGPRFFLLSLVSDRFWFDGFECFRIADIANLRPDPHARFAEMALKKRGERKPKKPPISMSTVENILISASKAFPLVTIHRERIEPDICHIGRVLRVRDGRVLLL